jgi:pentatricopeptide repeat protein
MMSLVTRYAKNGCFQDSLDIFSCMHEGGVYRNQFTFTSVFNACASLEVLLPDKHVHADNIRMGFQYAISVGNASMNTYAKCGRIHNARKLFDTMPERDVILWTSMIAGYAENEHWKDALELFAWMLRNRTMPNQSNLNCILGICTSLATLEDGKQIHTHTVKTGFVSNVNVGNVLVSMYTKCGEIDVACLFFEKRCERNVLSWNSMIVG